MEDIKWIEPLPTDISLDDYYVVCEVCNENMEYKVNFSQEHERKTGHDRYLIKPKK